MSTPTVKLRPAWRNYWFGGLVMGGFAVITLHTTLEHHQSHEALGSGFWFWLTGLLLVFLIIVLKRWSWAFVIDQYRISRHYGIFSRNEQSVRIKDLRSVALQQSLWQRLLGIGDLAFYSAGSADAEVRFFGIARPVYWRDRVYDAMDQLKD